jgi:CRISPR-associated protein Cmr2
MDWKLKIQALLYPYPPDLAINPNEAGERARKYLQSLGINDSIPDHILQAHKIAFGLDVPPFIRQHALPDALVLTHPLSGESESLKTNLSATQAHNAFQKALKKFSGLKDQKLFIALWRFLAEVVHKEASNPYWGLLPADPRVPDHSIWDHASLASAIAGTWDENEKRHKPALLLFTIGSVQEFLMTARRTQDLWMGSYLLSYLIWEAIKVVADRCGPDCLIYPDLRDQPLTDLWLFENFFKENNLWSELGGPTFLNAQGDGLGEDLKIASFPNMFTAIVPEGQASQLAKKATDVVHCAWKWIAANVRTVVEAAAAKAGPKVELSKDNEWSKLWEKQVPDLIDRLGIFWVIYPLDRAPTQTNGDAKVQRAIEEFTGLIELDPGDAQKAFEDFQKLYEKSKDQANIGMGYSPVSQLAARVLSNRKNLRNFGQHEAPGEKCSMCGVRSALHPQREFWKQLMDIEAEITLNGERRKVKLAGRIRKGDRLCAVCLTKRLAWEHHFIPQFKKILNIKVSEAHLLFPSTSSIAAAKFKERVLWQLRQKGQNSLWSKLEQYVKRTKSFLESVKRFFPSAEIAKLAQLAKEAAQELGGNSQDALDDFLRLDGDWLYSENFELQTFEREYEVKLQTAGQMGLKEAEGALQEFLKGTDLLKIARPPKYYALIAMDGDHMGQWVSGQKGPELLKLLHPKVAAALVDDPNMKDLLCRQRPLGPTLHRALTAAQKNFALQVVRQIVEEEHVGKLIYAGGDDVLAFVPISELLPVLRKLRWLCSGECVDDLSENAKLKNVKNGFATRVNSDADERRFMLLGSAFSLSAGVAIVHHTHPFSHAVEEAYRAMKEHAKKELGRNAFAIHLMKRSGEPLEVGAKWKLKANGEEFNTLAVLEEIVRAMQGGLSPKLAYDLKDEALGMALLGERKAQLSEIKRLVKRHVSDSTKKEALADRIAQLFEGLCAPEPAEVWEHKAWERLTGLLLLARFLAQGGSDGGE